MARAPFQVLVFPFIIDEAGIRFALFRRNVETGGYWQGIAGGGEDEESFAQAASRESMEEAGISIDQPLLRLDTVTMVPVVNVCGFRWGNQVLVIPEYAFGVEVASETLKLSKEHTSYAWYSIDEALSLVKWDSNKTALWELHYRLENKILPTGYLISSGGRP